MSQNIEYNLTFSTRKDFIGGLPVVLVEFYQEFYLLGLMDTGSAVSFLSYEHASVARVRHITDHDKAVKVEGLQGRGSEIIGYEHEVDICINKVKMNKCPIVFIDRNPYDHFGISMIVGRNIIFDRLKHIAFEATQDGSFTYLP